MKISRKWNLIWQQMNGNNSGIITMNIQIAYERMKNWNPPKLIKWFCNIKYLNLYPIQISCITIVTNIVDD